MRRSFSMLAITAVTLTSANTAHVALLLEPTRSAASQPTLDANDRAAFVDRVVALGVGGNAVTFAPPHAGSPVVALIEVPIARLPKLGEDIAEAATRTIGRAVGHGVWFTHTDRAPVRDAARKQALADAQTSARSLATAGGTRRGPLTSVLQFAASTPAGAATPHPCTPRARALAAAGSSALLKPFDATPEFTVQTALSATSALE